MSASRGFPHRIDHPPKPRAEFPGVLFPAGTGARLLLCALSVAGFRLSFPGGPAPWLVWVCLVPGSLAVQGLQTGRAFLWGLLMGFSGWILSVWWMTVGLTQWVGLPGAAAWTCTALFCLYSALPYALSFAAWARCREPFRPRDALFSAALLTAVVSWFPQIFPGNPAHALFESPLPIQVLDLGGVPLLLFLVTLVNRLAAGVIIGGLALRPVLASGLVLVLCVSAISGYGLARLRVYDTPPSIDTAVPSVRVAAVQPNIPVRGRSGVGAKDRRNDLGTLFRLTEEAAAQDPSLDLIVWPEIPTSISCRSIAKDGRTAAHLSRAVGIPLLTPCIRAERAKAGAPRYRNMTLHIRPDGRPTEPYTKRILVPFSEYLPLEKEVPFLRRIFPGASHYVPGEAMVLFELGAGRRVIPAVCYESVFSGHVREGVEAGGNIIVNMVDDAWFGRTAASAIHMALGVFRAVEFRAPFIRVTNSGNGVFVRASGKMVPGSRTPLFEQAVRTHTLDVPDARTPFVRWGDAVLWLLTALALPGVFARLRKRSPRSDPVQR